MEGTLFRFLKLVRYRFLLIAGLLPYGLGTAIAFHSEGRFDFFLFLTAFTGLVFVLIGVESFNEYFDWRIGTDRVFQLDPRPVTNKTLFLGLAVFSLALIVAIYLTRQLGPVVILLAVAGFFGALFYLAPPVKLIYRGFGELTIAVCYGPLMSLGGYYVQAQRVDSMPLFASVIPALLIFTIAILNEVPDYFQDRLVGKRNICVRIGRKNTVRLYGAVLILVYAFLLFGLLAGKFPPLAWAGLACMPFSWRSYTIGMKCCEDPREFLPAIRSLIIIYVTILTVLITAYIVGR